MVPSSPNAAPLQRRQDHPQGQVIEPPMQVVVLDFDED
jgi:hypothetical protein